MARSRSVWVLAVVVAALCCTVAVQSGSAQTAPEVLPDLVADAPARPQLQTYAHPDGTTHLLLRFDGFVHNRGQGALEVRGSQPLGGVMQATVQRVYRSDGSFTDDGSRDPEIIWEPEDGHDHWHLKDAARYSLWNAAKTAEVAPAMKVGFCLIDSQHVDSHGPRSRVYTTAANGYCAQGNPGVSSLVEGISAGWRDVYTRGLAFQWVDVTDVQPGTYWLRAEVDPDNWARESNEFNPPAYASRASTIPGYVATPVDAGIISETGPTQIRLGRAAYGSNLGTPSFRILTPPRHGRLNRGVGSPFQGADVVYTPDPGWAGPDRFTYDVRDSASEFPRQPAPATVTLNVGGTVPAIAISGAPEAMYTGTSVRLSAHLLRSESVSWAVNGVPGGNPLVGTIDPSGLYVAPARVPPSGQVTIRATTASGAWEEATIRIIPAPAAQPAPAARGAHVLKLKRSKFLYGMRVATEGDALLIRVRSRRAGVLRVRALRGRRLVGRCRARTPARRVLTCKVRLPQGVAPARLRLVITLRAKGKLLDVRRASLRHLRHV